MNKINPFSKKQYLMYQMIAEQAAGESYARKANVGAVIVLKTGLLSLGWNGTPPGFDNDCEFWEEDKPLPAGKWTTKPEVIHAERNALDKLTREGVSPEGSIIFVTTSPCIECAKSIAAVGITKVIYRDKYKNDLGLEHLKRVGVEVEEFQKEWGDV